MRKLRCKDYLNLSGLDVANLVTYTRHLFKAHSKNRPSIYTLLKAAASTAMDYKQAHQKVNALADQFEENYDMGR